MSVRDEALGLVDAAIAWTKAQFDVLGSGPFTQQGSAVVSP